MKNVKSEFKNLSSATVSLSVRIEATTFAIPRMRTIAWVYGSWYITIKFNNKDQLKPNVCKQVLLCCLRSIAHELPNSNFV